MQPMKAAQKTNSAGRMRGLRALLATIGVAAVCAAAALGLSACQEEEPTSVTITVVCTDEMRVSLADRGITDAEGWLTKAAARFAATYEGLEVTVNVVSGDVGKVVSDLLNPSASDSPGEGEGDVTPDEGDGEVEDEGPLVVTEPEPTIVLPEGDFESDPEDTPPPDAIASLKDVFGLRTSVSDPNAPGAAASALVPDILFGSYAEINPAVLAGKAVPLDDLITSDMRAYVPESILTSGTQIPNGKTYLMPYSASPYVFIIDGDLFRAAGIGGYAPIVSAISDTGDGTAYDLSTPEGIVEEAYGRMVVQTWTPEEWTEVLETLVAELPGISKTRYIAATTKWSQDVEGARIAAKDKGEDPDAAAAAFGPRPEQLTLYPMMMFGAGDEGTEYLMALMSMFGGSLFDEDGYLWTEDAEGIASGDWLATGVVRGYFPPNAETLTYEDCVALFENGQLGILAIRADQVKDFLLAAVNVPASAEGEAADGEAAEVSFDDLYMTRRLSFVTFPRWELEAMDAWKADLGLYTGEEGVSGASESAYATARGMLPAEFYGFAVIDNGDELKVKVAKEFVGFIMSGDDWLAYEAVEGQLPVDTFIFDTYAHQMTFMSQFREDMEWTVNLSGNVPEWDTVLKHAQQAFAVAVTGKKTPVEITASLNKAANEVLEPAWLEVTLHE